MEKFNPCLDLLQKDPYPVYREYRRMDPVHLGMPPMPENDGSWYLFRYDDVEAMLKNPVFINDRQAASHTLPCSPALLKREPLWRVLSKWILISDPPAHTRIRSRLNQPFSRKAISVLAPLIEGTMDQLLDTLIGRGEMELVSELATPLPVAVISRLLGIRIENVEQFRIWSRSLADALDMGKGPDSFDRAMPLMNEFVRQLRHQFRDQRLQPEDGLLSSLLTTMDDDEGIDEDELISLCTLLMFAGQETTIDAIGNSVLTLLQHPEQLQLLKDNPGLLPGAVEELLRYNNPLQMSVIRVAREDIEIGGKRLRKGDNVTSVLGAANRDPDRFTDPDRFDITRKVSSRDVFFGQGIHRCLGAHLARLEIQIVLGALLRRTHSIQLASKDLQWRNNVVFRGLTRLPVTFKAA